MVTNTARGQLNRENTHFPVLVCALRIWSREMGSVARPALACSFFTLRLNLVLTHGIPPDFYGDFCLFIPQTAIGSVPTLSSHAIAYRWRSLPSVHRHRASSPQSSSSNGCSIYSKLSANVEGDISSGSSPYEH